MRMNDTHALHVDPTLEQSHIEAPGVGVPGKTLGRTESGWGGPQLNDPNSQNHQLDTLQIDVTLQSDSTPSPLPKKGQASLVEAKEVPEKKLVEFYETPTQELLTFEERALVNPRELAAKLLSRVEYYPSAGLQMVEFFLAKAKYRITMDVHYRKDGEMREFERHIPNSPPMFSEFGRTIGVSERTLKAWAKKEPAFQEAFEICQDIIQEFFVENGVKGDYSAAFAIFAAKNLTKMKDVTVNKNEVYDMKGILDSLEKGMRPE